MNDLISHGNPIPLRPHFMSIPSCAFKQHLVSLLLKPELTFFRGHVAMKVRWVNVPVDRELRHGGREMISHRMPASGFHPKRSRARQSLQCRTCNGGQLQYRCPRCWLRSDRRCPSGKFHQVRNRCEETRSRFSIYFGLAHRFPRRLLRREGGNWKGGRLQMRQGKGTEI